MAASVPKYPLGSSQEHIVMCESHDLPIDMLCEVCDEFICGKCDKTEHEDHECNTLPTAATKRRRGLLRFLMKIKERDRPRIDEEMEKVSKRIAANEELCDTEIEKLQKHVDEIIARLREIRKNNEQRLIDNLEEKNKKLNSEKSELDKKKKEIEEMVKFMEENNSTMSDYGFIDNHRELEELLFDLSVDIEDCKHSARYSKGEICNEVMENLIGKIIDLNNISLTETNSFKYGNKEIRLLSALCEDQCYIKQSGSDKIEQVNKKGKKIHKYNIKADYMCVTDTGDVYFADRLKKSIGHLSPPGSVSEVISTDPLIPRGICQSVDGGLLVTLIDESLPYRLEPHSRRLVRHITVTGDVIHEYEFQEDGHTRLFTLPGRVTQNSNCDICVVNTTHLTTSVLVIMSSSGRMKSVYRGDSPFFRELNLTKDFNPTDVVCDSLCNILVNEFNIKQIHLLGPDGEFLKFLQTDNELNSPYTLSLYKSTLWVGYKGIVKVFQYRM
ncbi:uncharacterized protein LOC134254633 [Saccostrea cucullata]|uniref:uncharacterized protein LOC134254633 n=1 Tax=Saccostrea cuccullata TaxID=36930 RepID=UPI002ED0BADA